MITVTIRTIPDGHEFVAVQIGNSTRPIVLEWDEVYELRRKLAQAIRERGV